MPERCSKPIKTRTQHILMKLVILMSAIAFLGIMCYSIVELVKAMRDSGNDIINLD